MIAKLRKRKQWQQERLLDEMRYYSPSLHRLEKGELLPREDALKTVLNALEVPMQEMICPHLDDQPMNVYTLRYKLMQALDNKDRSEAEGLFDELSALKNSGSNVNRQFYLSQKARLLELQKQPDDVIISVVIEGIKLTYNNFNENSPGDMVLVFEEPGLFHTLARCYARIGRVREAIRIIEDTYKGLQYQPIGERERDLQTLPLLISLTNYYYYEKDYIKSLKSCELGLQLSASSYLGKSTPELLCMKADILSVTKRKNECNKLLKMAYAGYILMGEKHRAIEVLNKAKLEFGVEIDTYGTESLDIQPIQRSYYVQGEAIACKTIGEMIRTMRKQANLSLKDLSQGICSIANLGKIENDEIQGHIHYLEPILQRLGRDPLLYCNFFLSKNDFDARELRDSIHFNLSQRKIDEATVQLEKLKSYKAYKNKANHQFIKRVETEIFALSNNESHNETQKLLLEAIAITIPDFNEKNIEVYPLSLDESIIISELAASFMESGELKRAEKIYESLVINLNARYVDEFEKARIYDPLLANYSTCLGRMNKRYEALEVIEEAERFNRNRGRLSSLDLLAGNKGYNYMKLGDRDKSLSYLVLAYYCYSIFIDYEGDIGAQVSHSLIKENFDVNIN